MAPLWILKAPAPLLWRRPKAASIYVDGKAAVVALQPTPTPKEGQDFQ